MLGADDLDAAGLGLQYGLVELVRVPPTWVEIGVRLSDELQTFLAAPVAQVEHIGSTSILGLLAKPIIDVAIGASPGADLTVIVERLSAGHWIYRGDAGDQGGHVLVLEGRERHRVAHAHVVEYGGPQWCRYLALRQTLRTSDEARHRYESEKQRLVDELGRDNTAGAYTDGKTSVIAELLQ